MAQSASPYLSIIIPAYNEAERILTSLFSAIEYLKSQQYAYEIIVVDDGSRDDTVRVVELFGHNVQVISQGQNKGKGAAVKVGMLTARGHYRLFTDADFSTPIAEVEKLLLSLESGYDVCIGSRRLDPSLIKVHQPWYREVIGVLGNRVISSLLFQGIEDTQCGFKALTAASTEKIFPVMRIDGFGFDAELLYLAHRFGCTIDQRAVLWYNDDRSRLNPIRDTFKTLREVLSIRKIHKNTFR